MSPHLSATIRCYVARSATLERLVDTDTMPAPVADLLRAAVRARASILVSGETGSGKTTLLAALMRAGDPVHAQRLIEESSEVEFAPIHGGRYQLVDQPGADSLRKLVKLSLRFRPDIIIVGEVRAEEAWELARASRVGAGFLATIHARDGADALEALVLTSLGAQPNITPADIRRTFGASLDLVVHCARDDAGEGQRHQVVEVRALVPATSDDAFSSEVLFHRDRVGATMTWTGNVPPDGLIHRLEAVSGRPLRELLQ